MTLHGQILAAQNELERRRAAYPHQVKAGALSQAEADFELEAMRSIVRSLETLLQLEELVFAHARVFRFPVSRLPISEVAPLASEVEDREPPLV